MRGRGERSDRQPPCRRPDPHRRRRPRRLGRLGRTQGRLTTRRTPPLVPLLAKFDATDITNSPKFTLLSPALFAAVTDGGIYRKGVWGGKNGMLWEHYPDMTTAGEAASDHAGIWADIEL
jgi:hypothetical protein